MRAARHEGILRTSSRQPGTTPNRLTVACRSLPCGRLSGCSYTENVCYADLIIMGSQVLAEKEADALGSVCAKVAKKTEAHILIAKHFATMFG